MGGSPKIPSPPPPPPLLNQPNIDLAGLAQDTAARGARGASSTIRTGPQGLPPADTAQRTLLG